MNSISPDSMLSVLGEDIDRARELAAAMTADPIAGRGENPWTVQEVLGVALGRGLEALEQRYLKVSR